MSTNKRLALFIAVMAIAMLICGGLTACENKSSDVGNSSNNRFKSIEMPDSNLVYDKETKIVYIRGRVYGGFTYTNYYSENGRLCKYNKGNIIEIDNMNYINNKSGNKRDEKRIGIIK